MTQVERFDIEIDALVCNVSGVGANVRLVCSSCCLESLRVSESPALDCKLEVCGFLHVCTLLHNAGRYKSLVENVIGVLTNKVDTRFVVFTVRLENFDVALLAARLQEDAGSAIATRTRCTTNAMQMVRPSKGGIEFDDEIDVGKIETTRSHVSSNEDGGFLVLGEMGERRCSK